MSTLYYVATTPAICFDMMMSDFLITIKYKDLDLHGGTFSQTIQLIGL